MELCLVVAEPTVAAAAAVIRDFGALAQSFEIRADFLAPLGPAVVAAIRRLTPAPLIFTVRKPEDGGKWVGTEKDRRRLYEAAMVSGYNFIDLETGSFPGLRGNNVTTIIRSHHDMHTVPADILALYEAAAADPDEIPKIAATLGSSADVLAFLLWTDKLRSQGTRKKIITAMGERGTFSRVLGDRIGSMQTYAPAPGKSLLPGMLDIVELAETYRVPAITKKTEVYGFIDPASSFIPPDAEDYRGYHPGQKDAVCVPFVLDTPEEAEALREHLEIRGFWRTAKSGTNLVGSNPDFAGRLCN
jgi:3-dehydroquinate dehydratase / shikimate dehydrogenase